MSHELTQGRRDCQAETRPTEPSRSAALCLLERLKDLRETLGGNSDSRVLDLNLPWAAGALVDIHCQSDASLIREFQRVAQQIDEDLFELLGIRLMKIVTRLANFSAGLEESLREQSLRASANHSVQPRGSCGS